MLELLLNFSALALIWLGMVLLFYQLIPQKESQ